MVIYTVYLITLTTQDQQELQLSPTTIPSPRFRFTHSFKLPQGHSVVYVLQLLVVSIANSWFHRRAQLLEGEKLLLVVADCTDILTIYLENLAEVDGAIRRGRGKALNREKIGQDFLLAYDESKRMLVIVSSDRVCRPASIQFGTDTTLPAPPPHIRIRRCSRFSGLGQLDQSDCLVQRGIFHPPCMFHQRHRRTVTRRLASSGQSFLPSYSSLSVGSSRSPLANLTCKFPRPATLNLDHVPLSVSSTPDGSCLLVAQARGSDMAITAYQWDTFGFTDGIALDIPDLHVVDHLLVTSLISRSAVHLVTLDFLAHTCQSYALDITRRVMKFVFNVRDVNTTAHNCIIDCHSEVWTRFPVLPAVPRETISSSSLRSPRTLGIRDRPRLPYVCLPLYRDDPHV
jgi:hypothetical protein